MMTMSKGVYVPADPQFSKHFHCIGMHIEDEVVVGLEHAVVLRAAPTPPKRSLVTPTHYFLHNRFVVHYVCYDSPRAHSLRVPLGVPG
jgi:hypothetical protein